MNRVSCYETIVTSGLHQPYDTKFIRLAMTHSDLYCTSLSKLVSACFHLSFELLHEPALHTDCRRSLPASHLGYLKKKS